MPAVDCNTIIGILLEEPVCVSTGFSQNITPSGSINFFRTLPLTDIVHVKAQAACSLSPFNVLLCILSIIDQQPTARREQMIGLVKAKQSTDVDH